MKRLFLLTFGFLALVTSANAQDEEPKHIRFITLGELPVWKEELKDGIRVGQEAPPGSMPPKKTSLLSGEDVVKFKMTLRAFSDVLKMRPETAGIAIKKGETAGDANWVTAGKPAAPLSLGVLYRDPNTMSWDNPKMMLLKDDGASFKVQHIRFVNVSENTVLIKLNGSKQVIGVEKGGAVIKPLKEGLNQIMVGFQTPGGQQKVIWNNQIRVLSSQRVQCFFYKAQDPKATGEVRFHYTQEPVPRIPRTPR